MVITFCGHRQIDSLVNEEKIIEELTKVILENFDKNSTVFLCGGYGKFDYYCAKTVKILKGLYPNIKSFFVSPYKHESFRKKVQDIMCDGFYDRTIYPDLKYVPYKFAILERNKYMINSADLIIAYINHCWGGAYSAYVYAKSKNKKIINLGDNSDF